MEDLTEFEENVLNDAVEWYLKSEETILEFNESNVRIYKNLLINSKEHMKDFMNYYWDAYIGDYSSAE